jgi:hypothetical protein
MVLWKFKSPSLEKRNWEVDILQILSEFLQFMSWVFTGLCGVNIYDFMVSKFLNPTSTRSGNLYTTHKFLILLDFRHK